ncbi:MAG: ATP-binding cassette domain-containing protein [Patescibacteria group bacterium]|nr:ATP-binding cassette domain-containing protein [Patescibacteria group bacterium]MBU1160454.1 ATP-binding cassette domain-containing protein [Patescibacteria group bacterium]MBU1421546.1 ATP-binding cassette domain-containing protein [Patescibacteria group bacterium]MBU1778412.1 ATP-binding cassette domain-containing protein [Patescibacteria group bacterium]
MSNEVILRFDEVTFEYLHKKPILDEASFSVRNGAKVTLMGQNGAGKSTLFELIKGDLKAKSGKISTTNNASVGTANQTISREDLILNVEEYFAKAFEVIQPNLKNKISKVMEAVNLDIPLDRRVGDLSGGQQAKLLLAFALIQSPNILLLDEPTNNLDKAGIDHLIEFLIMYDKTVIVISHDADFLNCFTEGVIYLDIFTHKIETYTGDYYSVVEEVNSRIEREKKRNAQLEKTIKDRKEKVNFFAQKGGKMRKLAKKMRTETVELEENKIDVRQEDKTIKKFTIPAQDIVGKIVLIESIKIIDNHGPVIKKVDKILRKGMHLLVSGRNGVGKSTFLRSLASKENRETKILDEVCVGYYSQDFANLNFDDTVFDFLENIKADGIDTQEMRAVAAGFLITGDLMDHEIGHLSEGQKGLLSFAMLVLMRPGLLILDEPTNHINFRHIPIIAEAINNYEGTVILVSHMDEFVKKIKVDDYLDFSVKPVA